MLLLLMTRPFDDKRVSSELERIEVRMLFQRLSEANDSRLHAADGRSSAWPGCNDPEQTTPDRHDTTNLPQARPLDPLLVSSVSSSFLLLL